MLISQILGRCLSLCITSFLLVISIGAFALDSDNYLLPDACEIANDLDPLKTDYFVSRNYHNICPLDDAGVLP